MMHRAWSCIEEVRYCFSRSSVKFQGHTTLNLTQIGRFRTATPVWEFTDGYEMLHKAWNSKRKVPYGFQGHPSNFKVTRDKTSLILTQIGRFRTIGRSQLSNPSDLPCYQKTNLSTKKMHLKLWFGKWHPCCPCPIVLIISLVGVRPILLRAKLMELQALGLLPVFVWYEVSQNLAELIKSFV